MNTKTIKNKTLGIFLSLALVLSMVAVVLPAQPVHAADATSVTITYPLASNICYTKQGGSVPVNYTLAGPGGANNVQIWIQPTTGTHVGYLSVTQLSGAPHTDIVPLNSSVAEGTYNVRINDGNGHEDLKIGCVVVDNTPPSVTLVSPNGGQCFLGGSAQNVTWIAYDTTPSNVLVTLDYTINAGSLWTNVFTDSSYATGSQTYSWTTPVSSSSICKVRINVKDAAGNSLATPIASTSYFTIIAAAGAPTVVVTAPNGGQTIYGGDSYTITWNATSAYSSALDYQIELDTGSGYNIIVPYLLSQPTSDRTYAWTVSHVRSTTCLIRVTARDCAGNTAQDVSNAFFTIADDTPPNVSVTAPNTGDNWYVGSSQTIRFTATDLVTGNFAAISLYLSTDGSSYTYPIAYSGGPTQGAKTQAWTIPSIGASSTNCKIRVTVTDGASPANIGYGYSNTFTITVDTVPPTVTVCAPSGGETWQAGTIHNITWTANDTPDASAKLTYTIALSRTGGAPYTETIATLPSQAQCSNCSCSYAWAVSDTAAPGVDDTNCKIQITATDPATNPTSAVSTSVFTIQVNTCPLETATITLRQGWNMISLEIMPTSTDINTVLSSVLPNVLSAWYYSGGSSGSWTSYAPGAPSSLSAMEAGKGYWLNMATGGPYTLTFQGRKCPCPPTPGPAYTYGDAGVGWYLVGYRCRIPKTVATYLGGTCGTDYVDPITGWDAVTQVWTSTACGVNMAPDSGYWVYFSATRRITPICAD